MGGLLRRRDVLCLIGATFGALAVAPIGRRAAARDVDTRRLIELPPPSTGTGGEAEYRTIKESIEKLAQRGGGTLRLPEGRYTLYPDQSQKVGLALPANITLDGAGTDKTTLVMADGSIGHAINAPFGHVAIQRLTIDGNAARRPPQGTHNIRFEGDNSRIDDVRLIDACGYGLALGQRRFVRGIKVKNLVIDGAGADGIDTKNRLGQTQDVHLADITILDFARAEGARGKAGIDLRGSCRVERVRIAAVRRGQTGLRFRHGEDGKDNGGGAHGTTVTDVRVGGVAVEGRAPKPIEGVGIGVFSRAARLKDVAVAGGIIGLDVGETDLVIDGGEIAGADTAVRAMNRHFSTITALTLENVALARTRRLELDFSGVATFARCRVAACSAPLVVSGKADVRWTDTAFEPACKRA